MFRLATTVLVFASTIIKLSAGTCYDNILNHGTETSCAPRFEQVRAVDLRVDCNYTNNSALVQWSEIQMMNSYLELVEIEYNCTNTTTNEPIELEELVHLQSTQETTSERPYLITGIPFSSEEVSCTFGSCSKRKNCWKMDELSITCSATKRTATTTFTSSATISIPSTASAIITALPSPTQSTTIKDQKSPSSPSKTGPSWSVLVPIVAAIMCTITAIVGFLSCLGYYCRRKTRNDMMWKARGNMELDTGEWSNTPGGSDGFRGSVLTVYQPFSEEYIATLSQPQIDSNIMAETALTLSKTLLNSSEDISPADVMDVPQTDKTECDFDQTDQISQASIADCHNVTTIPHHFIQSLHITDSINSIDTESSHTTIKDLQHSDTSHASIVPSNSHAFVYHSNSDASIAPSNSHASIAPSNSHASIAPSNSHAYISPSNSHASIAPRNSHDVSHASSINHPSSITSDSSGYIADNTLHHDTVPVAPNVLPMEQYPVIDGYLCTHHSGEQHLDHEQVTAADKDSLTYTNTGLHGPGIAHHSHFLDGAPTKHTAPTLHEAAPQPGCTPSTHSSLYSDYMPNSATTSGNTCESAHPLPLVTTISSDYIPHDALPQLFGHFEQSYEEYSDHCNKTLTSSTSDGYIVETNCFPSSNSRKNAAHDSVLEDLEVFHTYVENEPASRLTDCAYEDDKHILSMSNNTTSTTTNTATNSSIISDYSTNYLSYVGPTCYQTDCNAQAKEPTQQLSTANTSGLIIHTDSDGYIPNMEGSIDMMNASKDRHSLPSMEGTARCCIANGDYMASSNNSCTTNYARDALISSLECSSHPNQLPTYGSEFYIDFRDI